jgi:hypothetical protein
MSNEINKELPIAIGSDHAGFQYKEKIKQYLAQKGWSVEDKGTFSLLAIFVRFKNIRLALFFNFNSKKQLALFPGISQSLWLTFPQSA